MRRLFIVLIASTAALWCEAAQDVAGRWSGRAQIPGRDVALVIDLAKDAAGAWIGSMIMPGLDIKGAPLGNIQVGEIEVAFDTGDTFGAAPDGPAAFAARLDGRNSMSGEMRQGGNVAPFALKRAGDAQAELPARSTPVAREIEGRWIGDYEMGGYPRHVTVDLVNHTASAATVEFVVVGKATTQVPIDFVSEEEGLLRFESRAYRINFEGRIHKGEGRIAGTFAQGSIEVPLVLRREVAGVAHAQSMFRGGAAHDGVYAAQGPRQFHGVKWVFPTGNRVVSSPVMQGNVVFFGSDDGNVYAVDAASGRQLWKHATHGPVSASPAVEGDTLYVGSFDGHFYALDTRSGAMRWKFATGGERRFEAKGLHGWQPASQTYFDPFDIFLSSPVVVGGAVYFGSGDGNLYALDAASGELKWKFHTADVVHASPAYADGVLYFGSWDSWFYAVDARSGQEKWRFHGGEDALIHNQVGFQSSAAVVNGVVYVGCRDSNLYALDAATGKEKWRFNNAGSWVITSPAVTQGKVVFATSDSSLFHVVDAETGKPLAKVQGKAYMFASPAVAGGVVYQGVLNGILEARDLASGDLLWDFQTDASRENRSWVLTADRKFNPFAFSRSGAGDAGIVGTDRQFAVGSFFSSPLVAGGAIYVGSADGNLYAID